MTVIEQFDDEPEVRAARRAFATAQSLLGSQNLSVVSGSMECAWHQRAVHPEEGCFALVDSSQDPGLLDLVGEVLEVEYGGFSLFLYCVASRQLVAPLSICRIAFLKLAPLSLESIDVSVSKVN